MNWKLCTGIFAAVMALTIAVYWWIVGPLAVWLVDGTVSVREVCFAFATFLAVAAVGAWLYGERQARKDVTLHDEEKTS